MTGLLEGWQEHPCCIRGKVKRTSGPVPEAEGICVYLHIEEIEGRLKGTEAPLAFRVTKALSLSALLAEPGALVTIEWIPAQVVCLEDGERVYIATRFHLSRKVSRAFGDGFAVPKWAVSSRDD